MEGIVQKCFNYNIFIVILLFSNLLLARPFWTEKSSYIQGSNLYAVGIAQKSSSISSGRQRAFKNAKQEIINYLQMRNLSGYKIQTQMTFEEKQKDGTYTVWRLVKFNLNHIKEKSFNNLLSRKIGHQTPQSGKLKIITYPSLANIYLNSEILGKTNALFGSVGIGEYTISLDLENFVQIQKDITIKSGETTVVITQLDRVKSTVVLSSLPDNAKILIDKKKYGTTPLDDFKLEAGKYYTLEVKHKDFFPHSEKIFVEGKEQNVFDVKLKAKPSRITILSNPEKANILLDGKRLGTTPLINKRMKAGTYKIELSKDDYVTQTFDLEVHPNTKLPPVKKRLLKLSEIALEKKKENLQNIKDQESKVFWYNFLGISEIFLGTAGTIAGFYMLLHAFDDDKSKCTYDSYSGDCLTYEKKHPSWIYIGPTLATLSCLLYVPGFYHLDRAKLIEYELEGAKEDLNSYTIRPLFAMNPRRKHFMLGLMINF